MQSGGTQFAELRITARRDKAGRVRVSWRYSRKGYRNESGAFFASLWGAFIQAIEQER